MPRAEEMLRVLESEEGEWDPNTLEIIEMEIQSIADQVVCEMTLSLPGLDEIEDMTVFVKAALRLLAADYDREGQIHPRSVVFLYLAKYSVKDCIDASQYLPISESLQDLMRSMLSECLGDIDGIRELWIKKPMVH